VTEIHDEGHFVFSCSNVGPAKAVSNEADWKLDEWTSPFV
jgi:hypothetical protein